MPRGKPVELETRTFANQKEATAFFKAMLNRYRPKQRISDADAADLAALLKRHSEYHAKVGIGVDHFEVMRAEYGTQCFRLVRVDGTGEDFSYPHCIAGRDAG
ncbi:DCL family protein [Roseomonas chloroacetimidivorans]|uniref:DCL family protein n=1 Tax=Roseomonas chloroacetimidivorans TaxID=1766656 RepID=UPI003C7801D8